MWTTWLWCWEPICDHLEEQQMPFTSNPLIQLPSQGFFSTWRSALETGAICTCSLNMSFAEIRSGDLSNQRLPSPLVKSNFTAGDDASLSSASTLKTTQDSVTSQLLSWGVVYAFLLGSYMFLKTSSYHSLFSSTAMWVEMGLCMSCWLCCVCVWVGNISHTGVLHGFVECWLQFIKEGTTHGEPSSSSLSFSFEFRSTVTFWTPSIRLLGHEDRL